MAKRIAALACSLSIIHGSVCAAQSRVEADPSNTPAVSVVDKYDGPLRRAASTRAPFSMPRATGTVGTRRDDAGGKRPWVERHPVITGAIAGFGIGVGLVYLIAQDDREEFLTPISAGNAALVWGGVTAGLGALAGWGIGRDRQ